MKVRKDETGKKYGKWTVVFFVGVEKHKTYWLCRCDCGAEKKVIQASLRAGRSTNCGCQKVLDETGKKHGRLTVLKMIEDGARRINWECRCECGSLCTARGIDLRNGNKKSCGCLHLEMVGRLKRKEPGQSAFTALYHSYKRSAKIRGISFDLTREQLAKFTLRNCFYCGAIPANIFQNHASGNGSYRYSGVDRRDNRSGYIFENCVSCCKTCNLMKRDQTAQEFIKACRNVIEGPAAKELPEEAECLI